MFESIRNLFGGVRDFFVGAYEKVRDTVTGAYEKVTGTVSNVVGTVYGDIKSGVQGAGNIVNNVVTAGKDVIEHGQNVIGGTIQSVGQSFSWPLALAGGAVAIYFLSKK
jgi:phage-related protein